MQHNGQLNQPKVMFLVPALFCAARASIVDRPTQIVYKVVMGRGVVLIHSAMLEERADD
jgi:hypothetical protein